MDNLTHIATIISRGRHDDISNVRLAEEILVALGLRKSPAQFEAEVILQARQQGNTTDED